MDGVRRTVDGIVFHEAGTKIEYILVNDQNKVEHFIVVNIGSVSQDS